MARTRKARAFSRGADNRLSRAADVLETPFFVDGALVSLDPATVRLSGLWLDGYSVPPWDGKASIGASDTNDQIENLSWTSPSAGTPVNGRTPLSFNGSTDGLSATLSSADGIGHGAWTYATVAKFASLPATGGVGYVDPALFADSNATFGVSFSSSGVVPFVRSLDDSAYISGPTLPVTTGVWYFIQVRWNGTLFEARINGGEWFRVYVPEGMSAGDLATWFGTNYSQGAWFHGQKLAELTAKEAIPLNKLDGIGLYLQERYAQNFGFPTAPTAASVTATGISRTPVAGSPTVTTASNVTATGIATATASGSPTVTTASNVTATGISQTPAAGAPTVTSASNVTANGISSPSAFGAPTATTAATASPAGISSPSASGSPTVTNALNVVPSGISSPAASGSPSLSFAVAVSPAGVSSPSALGAPVFSTAADANVSPAGIGSSSAMGSPSLTTELALAAAGVSSLSASGSPTLTTAATVAPDGLASAADFGLLLALAELNISPDGVPSSSAFGVFAILSVLAHVLEVSDKRRASLEVTHGRKASLEVTDARLVP